MNTNLSEASLSVVLEALEYRKQVYERRGDTVEKYGIDRAMFSDEVTAIDNALTELQAAQAGEWRPVSERFLLTHDTGLRDHPKLFIRWNADDESILVGRDDGSFYHCPLPDNIRLWQRTIGSQEGRNE